MILIIVLLFFLLAGPVYPIDILPGDPAPGFSLNTIDGKIVSLSEYKDKTVVLIYWWPEQPRSLLALKDGQDILSRFKDRGVRVIGLTADTDQPRNKNYYGLRPAAGRM